MLSAVFRVLSDWLEVKLGGDSSGSEVMEEQPDSTLQTLCVANTLQENGQRTHKVHISIKVGHNCIVVSRTDKRWKMFHKYKMDLMNIQA